MTAVNDFLGLCDQEASYKYVSDFGLLRSYGRLKLEYRVRIVENKWNKILN